MKKLLYGAAAVSCLLLTAQAFQSQDTPEGAPNGDTGVEDDSCWKNNSGNEIEVEVRGTLHGDQEITVTEGDESGTGTGTPDPDGGCDDSSEITVGDETYRVEDGEMEWKNDSGNFVDMKEMECDKDDADVDGPMESGGGDTVGTLPFPGAGGAYAPGDSGAVGTLPGPSGNHGPATGGGDTVGSLPDQAAIVKVRRHDSMYHVHHSSGIIGTLPA